MSDRGSPEPAPRERGATALWVGAALLAAAATAVLVLSDDSRLLKLGLVAALWAALIGAFAVARLRGRVADDEERAAEQQRIYELELEREIAARHEFEAEAEAEARRRVAEESDNEIQALKAELRTLRESLEQMLGGDVLFERIALRAESTRVRSLTEHGGAAQGQAIQQSWGRELTAGGTGHSGQVVGHVNAGGTGHGVNGKVTGSVSAQNTEVIGRLAGEDQRRPPTRPPRPKPQQPVRGEPVRRDKPEPPRREKPQYERPEPAPVAQTKPSGTDPRSAEQPWPERAKTPPQEASAQVDAGAHAEGTSVSDLLAAYGGKGEAKRRRRRKD